MEIRVFPREIHETFCVQKGCKFYGKHAQQGICHTQDPYIPGTGWKHLELVEKYAEDELRMLRKTYKRGGKDYLCHLESCYVCDIMNSVFLMDELVRLRAENSLLRLMAGRPPRV